MAKSQCPQQLDGLAQLIYMELKGSEGMTRQAIKNLLRINHAHTSGLEVDEALDRLMGNAPGFRARYLWCDVFGRYQVVSWERNPVLRAHVVTIVQQRCSCEGANYYDILTELVQHKRFPQDHVIGCIGELQKEGILLDEGGGRFSLAPQIPENVVTSMVSCLAHQNAGG